MVTTEYKPKRKTTDVCIKGEDWDPIRRWIAKCREIDPEQRPPFLFAEEEDQVGIKQFMNRTRALDVREDVRLRLRHDAMASFGDLFRFWESCQDELKREFRDIAPPLGHFLSVAYAIEDALEEAFRPPQDAMPRPRCTTCGGEVPPDGVASVDVDGSARFWCPDHKDDRK